MMRIAAALAVCVLALASPAAAQSGTMTDLRVEPMMMDGRLVGCQAGFDVMRRDPEYHRGAMVLVSGSVGMFTVDNRRTAVVVKMGVAPADSPRSFREPSAAFLVQGYQSNMNDFVRTERSDSPGFRLFIFNLGESTTQSFLESIRDGRMTVGYQMSGGGAEARFPIDFSYAQGGHRDWNRCLQTLLNQISQR